MKQRIEEREKLLADLDKLEVGQLYDYHNWEIERLSNAWSLSAGINGPGRIIGQIWFSSRFAMVNLICGEG